MKFSATSPDFQNFKKQFESTSIDLLPDRRECLHPLTVIGEAMNVGNQQRVGINSNLAVFPVDDIENAPIKFPSMPRISLSEDGVDVPRFNNANSVLVLATCTEQELADTLRPIFLQKSGDTLEVNTDYTRIMGNAFRHGIEIADNVQGGIEAVLVVVTADGQAFDQIAFAAFVAKNLRAIFDIMPAITKAESDLMVDSLQRFAQEYCGESDSQVGPVAVGSLTAKVTEDGRTILVNESGEQAGVQMELPEHLTAFAEPETQRTVIVMDEDCDMPSDKDATEVLDDKAEPAPEVGHEPVAEATPSDLPM